MSEGERGGGKGEKGEERREKEGRGGRGKGRKERREGRGGEGEKKGWVPGAFHLISLQSYLLGGDRHHGKSRLDR